MATFELSGPDGAKYRVDAPDETSALQSFRKLTGAPQAQPDKYQQAAVQERDMLKSKGIDTGASIARQAIQGATMGGADEVLAGLSTPLEMIKRGTFDPREGYNYAKARENLIMEDARKNNGMLGTAAEIGGGVLGGSGLANAGATLSRPGMGLTGRILAGGAEGAGYGAVNGLLDGGDSFSDRFSGAGKGAAIGFGVGAGLPAGGAVAGGVLGPVVSNIRARINPEGVAQSQLARALSESGRSAADVERAVQQGAHEGQPFTIADALGNSGQRMLSTVTRSPGAGRQQAVEFLENRQAGQGRRISNALSEGFDSPQTAAQTEAALTRARGAAADQQYGQVRNDAGPVDVTGAIGHIERTLGPGAEQMLANPGSAATNDGIEAILQTFRNRLARTNPNDFAGIQRIRGEMADAAQSAMQGGYGNRARLIRGAVGQLDTAMENASAGHRAANQNFAQASRNIDAVQTGRDAAMRGRTEDIVPTFRGLSGQGQQAFRSGYVDPLIAQAQGAAVGVNKARPLMNDAFANEAAVVAPMRTQAQMQRRIARENTMFETRRQATGGSQTHDNAQDAQAMRVDPSIMLSLLGGHPMHAAGHAIRHIGNGLNGYTPAVREHMAELLLGRGAGAQISPAVQAVAHSIERRGQIARQLMNGVYSGTGVESQRK